MKKKKDKCYNCIFASETFKLGSMTHLHCMNEELYPTEKFENNELTGWDTLKQFNEICPKHQRKNEARGTPITS